MYLDTGEWRGLLSSLFFKIPFLCLSVGFRHEIYSLSSGQKRFVIWGFVDFFSSFPRFVGFFFRDSNFASFLKTFSTTTSSNRERIWASVMSSVGSKISFKAIFTEKFFSSKLVLLVKDDTVCSEKTQPFPCWLWYCWSIMWTLEKRMRKKQKMS